MVWEDGSREAPSYPITAISVRPTINFLVISGGCPNAISLILTSRAGATVRKPANPQSDFDCSLI